MPKQVTLNKRQSEALEPFKDIMRNRSIETPITCSKARSILRGYNYDLAARDIRRLSEYCRRETPPFCVCYAAGIDGLWLAETLEEAEPYNRDSGAKAFSLLEQRRNVYNHLRSKSPVEQTEGTAEIPEIDLGGYQEELF